MEPEPDCLSPQHVKARLQEIIEALKENRDIDVPETEIRELQTGDTLRLMRRTVQIVEVAPRSD